MKYIKACQKILRLNPNMGLPEKFEVLNVKALYNRIETSLSKPPDKHFYLSRREG